MIYTAFSTSFIDKIEKFYSIMIQSDIYLYEKTQFYAKLVYMEKF